MNELIQTPFGNKCATGFCNYIQRRMGGKKKYKLRQKERNKEYNL